MANRIKYVGYAYYDKKNNNLSALFGKISFRDQDVSKYDKLVQPAYTVRIYLGISLTLKEKKIYKNSSKKINWPVYSTDTYTSKEKAKNVFDASILKLKLDIIRRIFF